MEESFSHICKYFPEEISERGSVGIKGALHGHCDEGTRWQRRDTSASGLQHRVHRSPSAHFCGQERTAYGQDVQQSRRVLADGMHSTPNGWMDMNVQLNTGGPRRGGLAARRWWLQMLEAFKENQDNCRPRRSQGVFPGKADTGLNAFLPPITIWEHLCVLEKPVGTV